MHKTKHYLFTSLALLAFSSFAANTTEKIYEGEEASLHKLTIESNHIGFSGKGFAAGFYNNANGLLTFTIHSTTRSVCANSWTLATPPSTSKVNLKIQYR